MSRPKKIIALLAACLGLLVNASPAMAGPVIEITGHTQPTYFEAGGDGVYSFMVSNVGDESTSTAPVQIEVQLPPGVTTRMDDPNYPYGEAPLGGSGISPYDSWECPTGPDIYVPGQSSVSCTMPHGNYPYLHPNTAFGAGNTKRLHVFVSVAPWAEGPLTATAAVSGGGAPEVTVAETATLGTPNPPFGITPGTIEADAYDAEHAQVRQAGAHPFRATALFDMNLRSAPTTDLANNPHSGVETADTLRSLDVTLPKGLVGNPTAAPRCEEESLPCPPETQVGTIDLTTFSLGGKMNSPPDQFHLPVYNMVPPKGVLAELAFKPQAPIIRVHAKLDPRDYSVKTVVSPVNETLGLFYQRINLWGVPADPSHDPDRKVTSFGDTGWGISSTAPRRPFLSLPTRCGAPETTDFRVASWQNPGFFNPSVASVPAEANGCDQLQFEPTIEVRATTALADAPSGLEFEMRIPQNEDPDGLATAHLKDATVELPAGMTVNPPSADGLGVCSMAEVGISPDGSPVTTGGPSEIAKEVPVKCPEASKLGTVEVISPAVDHPLKGSVYLAEQNANPFGSLLAMYMVIEDPETGVLIKLPGKVDPDPNTGQLTATFRDNPQLPVGSLRLKFFEGPRAALKTPSTCGTHTTTATFTPWTSPEGADVKEESSFELTQGPGGGACLNGGGGAPNKPAFSAGTMDPTAKAFSPFVLKLARADGSQQLSKIETTLPKGLVAKLAGTTYCSDSALSAAAGKSGKDERASASCPATSRVGSVNVGAGAGSTPLYVSGEAYLAGPYKGAPLSLAIVTPAVAGPFDLGTVVVRTALQVNSETAQVKAVSDELPTILRGIPLNIRSVALKMDRPEFILNPTSCDPMSVDGSALSVFNQSATLTNPFQVGECNKLGFKPKLDLRLSGKTTRSGHPKLKATLTMPPGNANIARAQVTLPKTQFLEQSHIRTICTRVQYAAKSCPKGAVYGYAKAWTPLLDQPLEGPVYLRSSSNKLPDLVADLNGQIEVDLIGRIDSPNAMIRNTFELVPDAPVSKFVLTMQGGKKSLLVNNTNLCKAKPRATVLFEAQNGKVFEDAPLAKADCGKKGRKGGKKGKGGKRG